jgi:hypothetical protein
LEGKSSLFLDVIGIKVTRPGRTGFGPFKSYTRTIRFEFFGGEVLDITCSGAIEKYIKLRSVKTVKPVPKLQPANPDSEGWLPPKVYTGTSDRENT